MLPSTIQVIIVNWNAGAQLFECLRSFTAVAGDRVALLDVTVVDNASTDGSLDALSTLPTGLPLTLIRNAENRGFAAACNQGAAGSTADFLLFLNPDTRLLPRSLEAPARYLGDPANSSVGIVGIQLLDASGTVARNCARAPSAVSMIGNSLGLDRAMPSAFPPHFLLEWDHADTRPVDQVMGAFCFVRRSLFEQLAGFDERFFVYYEDLDLAMRARARGWRSIYLASASAIHHGGGTTHAVKDRRLYYFARSRILFALKYFGTGGAFAVAAVTLLVEPLARIARALWTRRLTEIGEVARGFGMLWGSIPGIVRTHRRLVHAQDLGSDAIRSAGR
jgi:GT2 family glycosyltransferase